MGTNVRFWPATTYSPTARRWGPKQAVRFLGSRRSIAEVCEGQNCRDIDGRGSNRSVDEYMATIGGKRRPYSGPDVNSVLQRLGRTWVSSCPRVIRREPRALVPDRRRPPRCPRRPEAHRQGAGNHLHESVLTLPVLLACERDASLRSMLAAGERDIAVVLPVLHRDRALEDTMAMAGIMVPRRSPHSNRYPKGTGSRR